MNHATRLRIAAERRIANEIVRIAMENCWAVTVNDGEEDVLKLSQDHYAVIGAMFSTDEDFLTFFATDDYGRARMRVGCVSLVYGNDGLDVVHDYTESELMAATMGRVDEFIASEWPEG